MPYLSMEIELKGPRIRNSCFRSRISCHWEGPKLAALIYIFLDSLIKFEIYSNYVVAFVDAHKRTIRQESCLSRRRFYFSSDAWAKLQANVLGAISLACSSGTC
ncbi:uncharacterized protein LOC111304557 [Durio zibethinus]|uniref:Uncharacterized protein LOC111304557 n=1 Tax=Durio zibethinus TaxID=66656 RepID=A0A6P5ZWX5_DURZI|nr:uncharacterized protein LOC111304557 [Durio zibethinus]